MARPAHTLLTFSGIFGDAATAREEWSFGLRCSGSTPASSLFSVANEASQRWDTWLGAMTPSNQRLKNVRAARILGADVGAAAGRVERDPDGRMLQEDMTFDRVGSGAQSTMPTHVALAASLVTSRSGPTGKGRIFLPFPAVPVSGADFLISAADALAVAIAVREFIDGLNAIPDLGPVSVISTLGAVSPVTGVRVGRVPDTQRSRRHRRDEGYQQVALTP